MHLSKASAKAYAIAALILFCSHASVAQISLISTPPEGIVHQYPLTGAQEVPVTTDIGIRSIGAYDWTKLQAGTWVAVGSISGPHILIPHLSLDRTVAIFHSATPFAYGEGVTFPFSGTLVGGTEVTDTVRFLTMSRAALPIPDRARSFEYQKVNEERLGKNLITTMSEDTLPPMRILVDDSATPGTIYIANFGFNHVNNNFFLFNLDEHGTIVRQKQLLPQTVTDWGLDFKQQPMGLETFYDINTGCYVGLDSDWNIVDTFQAINYPTDEHELRVFPDKSYALLGITTSYINMDSLIPNGQPSTQVLGNVIQKFDAAGNLIFEWRGIDHYNILDSKFEDLTYNFIDFEHANSLDFDDDGNIIMSNRHLCEISKINGVTGDFMWRLGGAHNQFKLIGDSIWFSFQHAARWLPNGDLTIFDNSNYDTITGSKRTGSVGKGTNGAYIQHSRACEYLIDTTARTITLVWQYHHSPETWAAAMGYVERLPNGNTLVSWGADTNIAVTEVRPDNSVAFEMAFGGGNVSYRAMKVPADSIVSIKNTNAVTSTANSADQFSIEYNPDGSLSALFTLSESEPARLEIFDAAGRKLASPFSSLASSGSHEFPLNLSSIPSGSYEAVFTAGSFSKACSFYYLK